MSGTDDTKANKEKFLPQWSSQYCTEKLEGKKERAFQWDKDQKDTPAGMWDSNLHDFTPLPWKSEKQKNENAHTHTNAQLCYSTKQVMWLQLSLPHLLGNHN